MSSRLDSVTGLVLVLHRLPNAEPWTTGPGVMPRYTAISMVPMLLPR